MGRLWKPAWELDLCQEGRGFCRAGTRSLGRSARLALLREVEATTENPNVLLKINGRMFAFEIISNVQMC